MARRKKHPRLPNGYGSIKYLGKNRRNPYGVYPPVKEYDLDGKAIFWLIITEARELRPRRGRRLKRYIASSTGGNMKALRNTQRRLRIRPEPHLGTAARCTIVYLTNCDIKTCKMSSIAAP